IPFRVVCEGRRVAFRARDGRGQKTIEVTVETRARFAGHVGRWLEIFEVRLEIALGTVKAGRDGIQAPEQKLVVPMRALPAAAKVGDVVEVRIVCESRNASGVVDDLVRPGRKYRQIVDQVPGAVAVRIGDPAFSWIRELRAEAHARGVGVRVERRWGVAWRPGE